MAAMSPLLYRPSSIQARSIPVVAIMGICALFLAFAGGGQGSAARSNEWKDPAQDVAPGYSPTQTVTLDLFVADDWGNPITDLTGDQIMLTENGVRQTITGFSRGENERLVIILCFDMSASRRRDPLLREELPAAQEFLQHIWRAGDTGAVVTFQDEVQIAAAPTDNLKAMLVALERIPPWDYRSSTSLFDALCIFEPKKLSALKGRKVFIVLSDFFDNASRHPRDDAIDCAWRAGARIFAVQLHETSESRGEKKRNTEIAAWLAESSGGEVFVPRASGDVSRAFQNLARILENSYLVSYTPTPAPPAKKKRTISIKILRNDVTQWSFPQGAVWRPN
jgi:VWFA-related protein